MPGVVRPRGELVDDQFAVAPAETSRPPGVRRDRGFATSQASSQASLGNAVREPRRGEGEIEDVIPVNIFANRKDRRLSVRSARDDDRDFLLEIDHRSRTHSASSRADQIVSGSAPGRSVAVLFRRSQRPRPLRSTAGRLSPARSSVRRGSRPDETARRETRRRRENLFPADDFAR